jgi:hypothetical protein
VTAATRSTRAYYNPYAAVATTKKRLRKNKKEIIRSKIYMEQNLINGNDFNDRAALPPPRSNRFKNLTIFTERAVKMQGDGYYMRVFYDGSSEFIRFDEAAKKWVFLLFPAA